jgi:hypothetical protein
LIEFEQFNKSFDRRGNNVGIKRLEQHFYELGKRVFIDLLKETGHSIKSYQKIFTVTDEKFEEHKKCEILYNDLLKKISADSIKPTAPIIHDPNNLIMWKIHNPFSFNQFK